MLDLVFKAATLFLVPVVILLWTLRSDVQALGYQLKSVAVELKRLNDEETRTSRAFQQHLLNYAGALSDIRARIKALENK